MTTTYTNFGGMVVKENRDGVKRGYVPDTQGNTVALVDDTGAVTDTWEYSPYGEVESHTGSSPTPFTWNGANGYYTDPTGLTYVRARYYNAQNGQWQTMDPLWPIEPGYSYCRQDPINFSDPSGLQSFPPRPGDPFWRPRMDIQPPPFAGIDPWTITCEQANVLVYDYCNKCWSDTASVLFGCRRLCSYLADWYYRACKDPCRVFPLDTVWTPSPAGFAPVYQRSEPAAPHRTVWEEKYLRCMEQATTQWERFKCLRWLAAMSLDSAMQGKGGGPDPWR